MVAAADGGGQEGDPHLDQLTWMSEVYPPFNFQDAEGMPRGIVTDALVSAYRLLGREFPLQRVAFLPWARSYARLQREPGTVLYSMVYTEPRQQLFRFVGPVVTTRVSVLALKERALSIDTPDDLARLRIGAVRDDIGAQLLNHLGVPPRAIRLGNRVENLIRQVQRGRLDAIAYSEQVAQWQLRQLGVDPGSFEPVYLLQEGALGIAFHRDTPAALLEPLQGALDRVRASGELKAISRRYLE